MAKVSPLIRSFNAGEVSILIEGRTDIDRYPASMRVMLNTVAAPQGPAIPRSGTEFINTAYDHTKKSILVPFVFSETDFYMIEFADDRIRFFTESGILAKTPVNATLNDDSPFFKFDSATLGASVGDQVVLLDFDPVYNLQGVVVNITAKTGTVYTTDIEFPALADPGTFQVAQVYHVASPYDVLTLPDLQDTPSLDVVYLTHPTVKPYKLKRNDTYDWAFEAVTFIDGPYMPTNETSTTLTVSATGKATPNMTNDTTPSGTASGSSKLAGTEYWHAFDDPTAVTYWSSNVDQTGTIQYLASSGFVCDAYVIHMATDNSDTNFTAKDFAPSTWTFEGSNDGSNWTVLDEQRNYVLYDNQKSVLFEINNGTSYTYHRLVITQAIRNGAVKPRVRSLIMRSTASTSLTVTASAVTGINNNAGFKATDVGRLIRIKGLDGSWRPLRITAFTNTTTVTATLLGEPFANLRPSGEWRLGYWSETTGYPSCATFHADRLWFGGSVSFPDLLVASVTEDYENMTPSSASGEVLDTHSIAQRINARRLSRIKWMATAKDGLLLGTGSEEYVVQPNNTDRVYAPGKIKATRNSARGSSNTPPAAIDGQVLYVQRSGRTVREYAYNYESDGYRSPSMSSLASHLGISPFVRMAYAAEPYSIVWMLRSDGRVVGLTYNRDENVVGWHRHKFPDGMVDDEETEAVIESIAVLPSANQLQDVLWVVAKRIVNEQTVRYVEKLTPFWDFGMTLDDAHFVDCGLRYEGTPITEVYGLQHLEGRTDIYGLADGIPVGPLTVTDGMAELNQAASNIILGIGFDSEGETSRLENGAQDGTAQGKVKRINGISLMTWDSYGGEVGTWNEDEQKVEYAPVDYPVADASAVETIDLFSGIVGPITPAPGFEKRGSVFFRRKKEEPLPFNIVAIMPQMVTQDR